MLKVLTTLNILKRILLSSSDMKIDFERNVFCSVMVRLRVHKYMEVEEAHQLR